MSLDVEKAMSKLSITQYDFDPNVTTAVAAGWVDMRDYAGIIMSFFRTVGTSALTMIVQASASSTGSSPETIVTKDLTGIQPDALGDYSFVEVLAEQIAQVAATSGKALRYVSLTLTFATGTDEGVVTYIRHTPRFAGANLSADNIS